MRRRALVLGLVGVLALGACGGDDDSGGDSALDVVAAFYPLAWAAEQVGGEHVAVQNLTPAGAEPHDLELSPDRIEAVDGADVVLVMGNDFQPELEAAAGRNDGTVEVLDALGVDGDDVHVWLDPQQMGAIVGIVEEALVAADPDHEADYRANAAATRGAVGSLDAEMETGLSDCERDTILTAHDAFGSLATRYGLRQVAIAGMSPDQEPSADRLAELADLAERDGVTTIFTEELVSPDIAETLAREAGGLETAVLNPLEGLTAEQADSGEDYLSIMRANLAELQQGLGCA